MIRKLFYRKQINNLDTFDVINFILLTFTALVCLFPFINIISISLSSKSAVSLGKVLWTPIETNIVAYKYLINDNLFWRAFGISILRVVVTVVLSLIVTILAAYPLSRGERMLPNRKWYIRILLFTMLFNAGLVPTFITIKSLGLVGSYAAIILPGLVSASNIILLMNFFKQIPNELCESAMVDGASHYRILWSVILPLSKPILATLTLFIAVYTWNEWFSPIIYLQDIKDYPLQTFLRQKVLAGNFKVTTTSDLTLLNSLSNKSLQSAQIVIAMIPVLLIYPFLQKYFTKGLLLGSVKE